jgi:hypothetical protein
MNTWKGTQMKIPTILASTALAVALFGATPLGHAAGRMILPKNSVGAAQLKKAAVTGAKVKDGSLTAADFLPGQLPAGPKGDKGDRGEPGAKGEPGAQGVPGLSGYETVIGSAVPVPANGYAVATATCPTGKVAIGGGFTTLSAVVTASGPAQNGSQWLIVAKNAGQGATVAAAVTCATVG